MGAYQEQIYVVDSFVTKFDELLEKTKECLKWAEKIDVEHDQTIWETHLRMLYVLNSSFDMLNEEKEGLNHLKDYLARIEKYTEMVYGPPADFM